MKLLKLLEDGGVEVDRLAIERLMDYAKLLMRWNSVHNLSGAKSEEQVYLNILDSLYPIKFIEKPNNIIDIGSGAGFPAVPIGIVWSSVSITLCEPLKKRASFLKFISLELGIPFKIEKRRVESLEVKPFELITSRAVSRVEDLIKLSSKVSSKSSRFLLFKGERVHSELKDLEIERYRIINRDRRNYLYIERLGAVFGKFDR